MTIIINQRSIIIHSQNIFQNEKKITPSYDTYFAL